VEEVEKGTPQLVEEVEKGTPQLVEEVEKWTPQLVEEVEKWTPLHCHHHRCHHLEGCQRGHKTRCR
jgi:hypothetical protein